ncbi:MAG: TetR family transcriptional regulator [Robiginitomaculum sp.]|nr:TetR family transcriptional regulator [Robiginitomaculum sp.]MDQ7078442.1 TetR family transcriptional regulator [Robiginitomaculum sp.]
MPRTAKRQSGKRTRKALLDAAFHVIASKGLEGASHREVAKQAGASPALTTYYFSSKLDLILQAFDHYVEQGLPAINALWQQAYDILDRIDDGLPTEEGIRELARLAANFLCLPENRHRDEIAFELAFYHQPRLEPELAERVCAYRERMREPALEFCRRCHSPAPQIDADLLMGLIARLEFEQLSQTIDVSVERAAAQLERLITVIIGHKE